MNLGDCLVYIDSSSSRVNCAGQPDLSPREHSHLLICTAEKLGAKPQCWHMVAYLYKAQNIGIEIRTIPAIQRVSPADRETAILTSFEQPVDHSSFGPQSMVCQRILLPYTG